MSKRIFTQEQIDAMLQTGNVALTGRSGGDREGRCGRHYAPTGGVTHGHRKTVIFSELVRERQGRALILGHRDELIYKAVDKLSLIALGAQVGIVKAAQHETDPPPGQARPASPACRVSDCRRYGITRGGD
jgi:hypothetical protein